MHTIREKSKFLWLGNWPMIDFVNTDLVIEGKKVDLLNDSADVVLWLSESRLCPGWTAGKSTPPKNLLEQARRFRSLLRLNMGRIAERGLISHQLLDQANVFLRRRVSVRQLEEIAGRYLWNTAWDFKIPADYLVPIAESFAKLISEADLKRVRKCKNPACVLYFYDVSKSGQRVWCSLDVCGNKLRMAASRHRRRSIQPN